MVLRVAGFQPPQHQAGGVVVRLVHLHHLETPLQCRVALKILLVFAPGGGRDGPQFAAGERRFQQVGRIRAARLVACADNGMRFVDEQQHRGRRLLYRINDVFQALFKLPLHACPRL